MAKLTATGRSETGSRYCRQLREQGKVPGVVYGHGEDVVPVILDTHDVTVALQHGERLMELDIEGKTENVLFKEVQWDTFGQELLHVDFARVSLDERVEVTVPVELRGTPAGEAEEGVLQQYVAQVTIECVVTAIPDEIRVMVDHMQVDDQLFVRDLPLPEGAELVDDPDALVAAVNIIEEELIEEEEEAAEMAEPEVIGAEEEAEGEQGAEAPEAPADQE